MQIGSENLDNGITFPDMITRLEEDFNSKSDIRVLTSTDSKFNFVLWFVDNFSCTKTYYQRQNSDFRFNVIFFYRHMKGISLTDDEIQYYTENKNVVDSKFTQTDHRKYHTDVYIKEFFKQSFFLNGSTNKQYIDYLELVESRESSQQALEKADESIKLATESSKSARNALVVSIITAIASIGLSIYEMNKPKPECLQLPYEAKVIQPVALKPSVTNNVDSLNLKK